MSHTDPLFIIPVGTVIMVGSLYMVVEPEAVHAVAKDGGASGWPRTLERVFGRRGALWVLRAAALLTAILVAGPVVHALQSLVGT